VIGISLPHAKQGGGGSASSIISSYLWSEGQNKILRTFGHKRDEIMRGWRELHKLHNLYSLQDIIRITKSKRVRWAGHVADIGEKGNA
jgi:hypothetical protein